MLHARIESVEGCIRMRAQRGESVEERAQRGERGSIERRERDRERKTSRGIHTHECTQGATRRSRECVEGECEPIWEWERERARA